MKKQTNINIRYISCLLFLILTGCTADRLTPVGLADLEHKNPVRRIRAIKWAGKNKIVQAIPLLVDRLEEQDESVRFFAIEALKRITGQDHGYNYRTSSENRLKAIKSWRNSLLDKHNTDTDSR